MSCAGTIEKETVYDQPIAELENEYFLGPGDVVEIIYHIEPQLTSKEYVFAVGDVISIEFYYHQEINRQVSIRPDGKISLPLVEGDVIAGGLTPIELKENLTKLYSNIFRGPLITVTPVEYNQAVNQLKETITTAPRGQSKLTKIRPDGYISFPLIKKDIKASGLTLPKLKDIVSSEYNKIIENVTISLVLEELKSNLVYVMGEVRNPDYYLMDSPTTATQILSRAGVLMNTARLNNIIVISRNKDKKPVGRIVDVEKVLGEGNIANDILLGQYDIVFVPKTAIALVDLYIDQYISQIVPRWVGLNFSYVLEADR